MSYKDRLTLFVSIFIVKEFGKLLIFYLNTWKGLLKYMR
jgi:hypothetical protein